MVYKFGEHPLITAEFTLLKCAVFAAIRLQFGDDLHLLPWCFEMDWKIAILITAEKLAIISVHFVEIWFSDPGEDIRSCTVGVKNFSGVTSGTFIMRWGC